jgi:hypothetical protein
MVRKIEDSMNNQDKPAPPAKTCGCILGGKEPSHWHIGTCPLRIPIDLGSATKFLIEAAETLVDDGYSEARFEHVVDCMRCYRESLDATPQPPPTPAKDGVEEDWVAKQLRKPGVRAAYEAEKAKYEAEEAQPHPAPDAGQTLPAEVLAVLSAAVAWDDCSGQVQGAQLSKAVRAYKLRSPAPVRSVK